MTNPVAPVEGHYALLRNGHVILYGPRPKGQSNEADAAYDNEGRAWCGTEGDEYARPSFNIIATISPADMQAVASGEIERLRAANEKMKSALAYYADDGPTPNVDGPWNATSWDFGTLARCTLADVVNIEGGKNL